MSTEASANNNMTGSDVQVEYSKMRAQISALATKVTELTAERNEYDLVVKTLEPMDPDRKCFRLVGGVLVERTVKEVRPAISTNLDNINKLIRTITDQILLLEKSADEFRVAHDLGIAKEDSVANAEEDVKAGGILV